jgi:hypothetical protein
MATDRINPTQYPDGPQPGDDDPQQGQPQPVDQPDPGEDTTVDDGQPVEDNKGKRGKRS